MDRNEHVGLRDARAPDPVAQDEKLIAIACQDRAHSGLAVDPLREGSRNGQRDIFFPRAAVAYRARVLAAVAGIDRHDDIAAAVDRGVRGANDSLELELNRHPRPLRRGADAAAARTAACGSRIARHRRV